MPLYEYQCDACGNRFERIQKFADPPVESCPNCGGAVRKLVSSPAFQFKGSGWYVTDYARSGKPDDAARTSAGDKSDDKKPDTADKGAEKSDKTETKGATTESAEKAPKTDKAAKPAQSSKD